MGDRFFSETEIAEMEKRTLDVLLEAVEAGDQEKAKKTAKRMYNEFTAMHDLYRDGVAALLSFIGRKSGDEVLEEAMVAMLKAWWIPALENYPKGPEKLLQRIKMFIGGARGHLQPLRIIEDDEKVTIQMHPCGSGGRQVLEGKYEGPDAFLTLTKPQRLTFGRTSFPVYCAQTPIMEFMDIQKNGLPLVVSEVPEAIGKEPCSFIFYKDPEKIPDKYFERVGLKKPST